MITDKIYSLDLSYLQSLQLTEIQQNIKNYPFSVNMRILRLLAMKAQNVENFETALQEEAPLIPDRALLKKRISVISDLQENIENQTFTSEHTINIAEEVKDINEDFNNQQNGDNEDVKSFHLNNDSINIQEQEQQNSETLIDDKNTSALENSPQQTQQSEEEESSTKKSDAMSEESPKQKTEYNDEPLSAFAIWLKNRSVPIEQPVEILKQEETKVEPVQAVITTAAEEKTTINEWDGIQEKILSQYQTDLSESKSKQKKKVKSTPKPKKKKENNTGDETTFITETYALLLEKQQKYSQALKIYDKLSLLFPEKRHYFAQKIELLKNL